MVIANKAVIFSGKLLIYKEWKELNDTITEIEDVQYLVFFMSNVKENA